MQTHPRRLPRKGALTRRGLLSTGIPLRIRRIRSLFIRRNSRTGQGKAGSRRGALAVLTTRDFEIERALNTAVPARTVFIGVALGQRQNHSAIVVLDRFEVW